MINEVKYLRPHSASASQLDVQFPDPQNAGPKPQLPYFEQHPCAHGELAEHVDWDWTTEMRNKIKAT